MVDQTAIAIIGYGYRAPGVGRKGLWEYLADAQSAWSNVPAHRFDQDAYYHADPEKPGCYASKGGHFLPHDIFAFDAAFFQVCAGWRKAHVPRKSLLTCTFLMVRFGRKKLDRWILSIATFWSVPSKQLSKLVYGCLILLGPT